MEGTCSAGKTRWTWGPLQCALLSRQGRDGKEKGDQQCQGEGQDELQGLSGQPTWRPGLKVANPDTRASLSDSPKVSQAIKGLRWAP